MQLDLRHVGDDAESGGLEFERKKQLLLR
jgi:hypothetical protein